jgi:hypothetical protein
VKAPEYYLAGGMGDARVAVYGHSCLLVPVNAIRKQRDIEDIRRWARAGNRIIIDSGAFDLCATHARRNELPLQTVFGMPPENIDGFAQLYENYVAVAAELQSDVFAVIEIDIGGKARKRLTRASLEEKGLQVAPVFHPLHDGWEYLDELAAGYGTVFVGNLVDADTPMRQGVMARLAMWRRDHPGIWLHLLGVTPSPLLVAFPPDSCDSSTWLSSCRQFSSWRAYALYDRLAGFGRGMAYVPKQPTATHEKAKRVTAFQHRAQALGLAHYIEEVYRETNDGDPVGRDGQRDPAVRPGDGQGGAGGDGELRPAAPKGNRVRAGAVPSDRGAARRNRPGQRGQSTDGQ